MSIQKSYRDLPTENFAIAPFFMQFLDLIEE
jgi:hypothetical protein